MQVCHVESAVFDDPNLVSCAGLGPVVALAEQCGLPQLVAAQLTLPAKAGANAHLKVPALVGAMVAGADSIADTDLLRPGGMDRLFGEVRAPSTLGTFLRAFTFGHVRQLDAVAGQQLAELSRRSPLLPGADRVAYVDIDDTVKATYGYAKQGAGYGYSGVKGLNALLRTVSSPLAAPVIVATRLRKGSTNSARGAPRLVADALAAATARRAGARCSITARSSPAVSTAIASIRADAWTPIHYPNAVWDEAEQRLISAAEIAEVPFTAFTSRRTADHISGRLIVRRVKRLNPTAKTVTSVAGGDRQGELFALYRYHAVFTDSPLPLVQAEKTHRAHAIIEQVHADLRSGPLAHLPSGSFAANSAWLVLAAIAFNLTRAAGCLASAFHAKATTGTIRAQLINIPARLARSARRLRMHLPQHWPWEQAWSQLFQATLAPPRPA